MGLEPLVHEEICAFGGQNLEIRPGAVLWSGSLESGYRACLWSRFASRILLELASFEAADPEALYAQAYTLPWDEHFTLKSTLAIYTTLVNSAITHSNYASLKVKDAIADQFRKRFGKRPNVDIQSPDIRLNVYIEENKASLALDFSGESLHKRGYRASTGQAPLKETLAAAIVKLSGWLERAAHEPILLDPMCGSGTLLIEAALMLAGSAPGLHRSRFGFMAWNKHDQILWDRLVQEALDKENHHQPADWPQFIGYDADPVAVAAARKNVINAGLRDVVVIRYRQLAHLQSPGIRGCMLSNPPYGERLAEKETVKYLYRSLGRIFQERFAGWSLGFFTANSDLADMLGLPWQNRYRLFNGPLKCQLLTACTEPVAKEAKVAPQWEPRSLPEGEEGEDFANRLRKNYAALQTWLESEKISCFRLYDQDLPDYKLAIDFYDEWIHVQEYAPPAGVDPERAEQRFKLALQVIRSVFDVPRSKIFIKTRRKQKGTQQYQKQEKQATVAVPLHEVRENGLSFLVNFTNYLDTGLFLDHRLTRAHIEELARGRTFLNLFGYTGTATVYAARGGASATTTVDISENYLDRCRVNMALNGFGGPLHQCVAEDCLQWLQQGHERFGLIFLDPPTFSNARHRKLSFDIQTDHPRLLRLAMQRLARSGVLIFSTNFRKFKLDEELCREFQIEEITSRTIPRDFRRNSSVHRCWECRHQAAATNMDTAKITE